ncbi:MAG: hypothetical protein JW822_00965 [Spirochaetales bacterium]|nr:hypothetical protein [Spirochaetales bacterium]
MRILKILTFLLVVCACASAQQGETAAEILSRHNLYKPDMNADDYNTAGFRLYQMKKYKEAAVLFREAINLDYEHFLANYNLACMLSLIYEQENQDDTYTTEIFHYLYIAITIDPQRRVKALKDPDLKPIRHLQAFKVITADPEQPLIETAIFKYLYATSIEYDLLLVFSTSNGETYGFDDPEGIFKKAGLYSVESVNDFPQYTTNQAMVNKSFKIKYQWVMYANEWSGMCHLGRKASIISKQLKKL